MFSGHVKTHASKQMHSGHKFQLILHFVRAYEEGGLENPGNGAMMLTAVSL